MSQPIKPCRDISRLIEIMAELRTPGTGCPWDLEQNFRSIAPYTIEEAYEVADAIERGDQAHLREELGDLLLQVVYHARMAEEENAFDFGDVVEAITAKMIRRHPHVFGDAEARAAGAAKGFWDKIKAEEKTEKARQVANPTLLADVPVGLPALTRAVKLQDKAAKVGFDWPSLKPVFDKLKEELAELEEEIGSVRALTDTWRSTATGSDGTVTDPERDPLTRAKIEEEFGDLLFVVANVARHLKLDPEAALRSANQKFIRRFGHIEQRLAERGKTPAQSDLAEMDAFWDEAKVRERGKS